VKATLDVHYGADRAVAACVTFEHWQDGHPIGVIRAAVEHPAEYRPGRFFERELPALLAVLEAADRSFEVLVIDGYVHLRPECGLGLGARLAVAVPYEVAVIGVAKSPLEIADRFETVRRGLSSKPLFVSSVGLALDEAARAIAAMHGPHRIPTLLRRADTEARRG
jgi:deoxyribonuclease V